MLVCVCGRRIHLGHASLSISRSLMCVRVCERDEEGQMMQFMHMLVEWVCCTGLQHTDNKVRCAPDLSGCVDDAGNARTHALTYTHTANIVGDMRVCVLGGR